MNEIEREKNELEALIGRLKDYGQTNPMRAQLASSLESIMTHITSVSGQLDIWRVNRDELKRYYAKKLSYQDVKNIYIYQKVEFVHYLESLVNKILLERQLNGSPSIGAYMMVLEIIFGIDGGWSLMPLPKIIMRS